MNAKKTNTTMIAMRAERFGGPEVLRAVEVPIPEPGPGQILLRVQAAAVNFADVMRRRASPYPFPTTLPYVPGSEVAGRIERLGEGVSGPPIGTPVLALVGDGGEGGYAELAIAHATRVIPIPPGLAPEAAASLLVAGTTAVLLLTEVLSVRAGETLLVPAAAGGVGSYAVRLGKHLGARVIAGASTEAKRARALAAGADAAIDLSASDWPDALRALAPNGIDAALEMEGGDALQRCLPLLAPFGRVAVYGHAGAEPRRLSNEAIAAWLSAPALGQSVTAFNLGLHFGLRPDVAGRAIGRLLELVGAGVLVPQVDHVLPLERAAEAHELLESRRSTGKIVLRPRGSR
jgi:NADPH2:quinone reductase